jgi:hypothetical protein
MRFASANAPGTAMKIVVSEAAGSGSTPSGAAFSYVDTGRAAMAAARWASLRLFQCS